MILIDILKLSKIMKTVSNTLAVIASKGKSFSRIKLIS